MKNGVQTDLCGREYDPFDARKIARAATLWNLGWDTRDIAWLWIVPEHHVYEHLEEIKEVSRANQRQYSRRPPDGLEQSLGGVRPGTS